MTGQTGGTGPPDLRYGEGPGRSTRPNALQLSDDDSYSQDTATTDRTRMVNVALATAAVGWWACSDTGAQLAAQRYWQRQKPVLDRSSGSGLMNAVSGLLDSANPDELSALAEEIPSYLASRGQTSAYWEAMLASKIPSLAAGQGDIDTLTKAHAVVQANQNSLHRAYDRGTLPPPAVDASPYDPDA